MTNNIPTVFIALKIICATARIAAIMNISINIGTSTPNIFIG